MRLTDWHCLGFCHGNAALPCRRSGVTLVGAALQIMLTQSHVLRAHCTSFQPEFFPCNNQLSRHAGAFPQTPLLSLCSSHATINQAAMLGPPPNFSCSASVRACPAALKR